MIYQIRSFNPLCTAKFYCKDRNELHTRIAQILSETNYMRLSLDPEEARTYRWENMLTRMEIDQGMEVITIDEEQFPDWRSYFGQEQEITDPIVKIENGVKIYPKRKEFVRGIPKDK